MLWLRGAQVSALCRGAQVSALCSRKIIPVIQRHHSTGKEQKNPKATRQIAGINFPDLIEGWDRQVFKQVGAVMTVGALSMTGWLGICQQTILVDLAVAGYWAVGFHDMNQKSHSILRNFPVIGNFRYSTLTYTPCARVPVRPCTCAMLFITRPNLALIRAQPVVDLSLPTTPFLPCSHVSTFARGLKVEL